MYTQCPECGTVFRVTAAVLRAAQGQVRCGVCDASFDALRFLTDDIELEVNAASASRIAGASVEAPAPPPTPAPPPEREAPRDFGAATRNHPSADEERALGEIAAILARGAQPRPAAAAPAADAAALPQPPAADAAVETNILEPADVEDIVLGDDDDDDIPDAALEFDLPVENWEQVFVRDPAATPAPPLDLDLDHPPSTTDASTYEAPDELVILADGEDPLARTDEYKVPDFGARLEREVDAGSGPIELELEPTADPAMRDEVEFEPEDPADLEAATLTAGPPGRAAPLAEAEPPIAEEPGDEAAHRSAPAWTPVPLEAAADDAGAADPGEAQRSGLRRVAAIAAVVLLALGLAAQLVHYNREALAESPLVGPALAAVYARLGAPLEPHWNLAAYDVRQWGAQSEEAAGTLRLRASIVNRAPRAQPFPLLRVTLEDRFGAHVGRREFTPAEYLPGRSAPRELLTAGARADADLSLADPGNQAVGFELDVCLPRHGAVVCGADAKAGGG